MIFQSRQVQPASASGSGLMRCLHTARRGQACGHSGDAQKRWYEREGSCAHWVIDGHIAADVLHAVDCYRRHFLAALRARSEWRTRNWRPTGGAVGSLRNLVFATRATGDGLDFKLDFGGRISDFGVGSGSLAGTGLWLSDLGSSGGGVGVLSDCLCSCAFLGACSSRRVR